MARRKSRSRNGLKPELRTQRLAQERGRLVAWGFVLGEECLDQGSILRSVSYGGQAEEAEECLEDVDGGAAVDDDALAGVVGAGFAGEEEGGAGEFARGGPAFDGGAVGEVLLFFVIEELARHVGEEGSGAEAVDGDAVGAEIEIEIEDERPGAVSA